MYIITMRCTMRRRKKEKNMIQKTLTSQSSTETVKLYNAALDELANMGRADSPEYIKHQDYIESLIEKMEAEKARANHEAATAILRRGH